MKHYSLDLETLGTNVDSQILSIGCCEFDIKTGEPLRKFYQVIDIPENLNIPATLGTIKFWASQGNLLAQTLDSAIDTQPVDLALVKLNTFIGSEDCRIWCLGTKFDLGMVEYQMTLFGIEKNWWHSVDRCLRTIREILGNDMEWPERHGTYHNALDDAIYQAQTISLNLNKTVYKD